jgi:hypothetical protein
VIIGPYFVCTLTEVTPLLGVSAPVEGHAVLGVPPDTWMVQVPFGSDVFSSPEALVTPRDIGFSVAVQPVAKAGMAMMVAPGNATLFFTTVRATGASRWATEPVPPAATTVAADRLLLGSDWAHEPGQVM